MAFKSFKRGAALGYTIGFAIRVISKGRPLVAQAPSIRDAVSEKDTIVDKADAVVSEIHRASSTGRA
jgi:hypothetical protein